MIKWIHQNTRSIGVFLIFAVVVLSMTFFGVDVGSTRQQRYAIKIGDQEISFEEFDREKRRRQEAMLQQYKQIFGDNYTQFASQIYNIPNVQIADDIIDRRLLVQEARDLNLYVGEQQLVNFIKNQLFGGNFDSNMYAAYLAQSGLSSRAFENQLRSELLIENYRTLLSDIAEPSRPEIENFIKTKETLYDVSYLEFDPAAFAEKVAVDDATLEKFYAENQTDYEIPAKVSYNYLNLNPTNSMQLVEISSEDIEFYYSENESKFSNPEQVKVRHIQINLPKGADEKKLEEIKRKAEEAHSKAMAGENFDIISAQYSEDYLTAEKGGDLGWVEKGRMNYKFDEAVFPLKEGGVAPLIETDYGYHIAKVEGYKEAAPKPLDAVRAQIEEELKNREAAAFISAKAYEFFDRWQNSDQKLEEVAKDAKAGEFASADMLEEGTDPKPELKDLTRSVLAAVDSPRQIVDVGASTVLVEVLKFEEARIPSFTEAKDKVKRDYQAKQSSVLAREAAEKIIEQLAADPDKSLPSLAKAEKYKIETQKGLSRANQQMTPPFTSLDAQEAVFQATDPATKPNKVVSANGKYYLIDVISITPPDQKKINEKFEEYRNQAAADSANSLIRATLDRLKATTELDIDQTISG